MRGCGVRKGRWVLTCRHAGRRGRHVHPLAFGGRKVQEVLLDQGVPRGDVLLDDALEGALGERMRHVPDKLVPGGLQPEHAIGRDPARQRIVLSAGVKGRRGAVETDIDIDMRRKRPKK